ncbi:MAG: hypothetical protein CVV44_15190 [Spirochaetae bacterium HGW-Spirochaetae-1]|jgi:hypothetical protein|nr:MAG: hypothetical protein CVV44_15190 [Spirochaetae bacterium HGW-Spirochaetae-1]
MKHKIIRIDSIAEIDTSKINVYDLNNRYIDPRGNIYGLKYDRLRKKIEIIRLVRTLTDEAPVMQHKIIQKKIDDTRNIVEEEDYEEELDGDMSVEEERIFDPLTLVNETLRMMDSHRERLKGIMMNIKNSNVFPKENKSESIELENIFRNMEIDGIQHFEKVDNYERELTSYPRSITYYQAKVDTHGRQVIEMLGGNNERILRFIHFYEMYNSITALYRNLRKILTTLIEFVAVKDVENMKTLTAFERQSFEDATVSIDNTMREIDRILDSMVPMGEYLQDPENF